jgi:hypothetical protein
VGTLVAMTLPALVIALILLGVFELAVSRRRGAKHGTALSGVSFEVLEAAFHPAKHHQIDERQSQSLMRAEQDEAAPPFSTVDLATGQARLVVPAKNPHPLIME